MCSNHIQETENKYVFSEFDQDIRCVMEGNSYKPHKLSCPSRVHQIVSTQKSFFYHYENVNELTP